MVAEANLAGLVFLRPILAFLVVFLVLAALSIKSKLFGENLFVPVVVSFALSTIFVASGNVKDLVVNVIPWFAVLLVALFMLVFLIGMLGKGGEGILGKGLGWTFVVLMALAFIFVGIKVFSNTIGPYVPGPYYGHGGDPQLLYFFDWLWSPTVVGTFIFAIVAIATMVFLVKSK